MNDIRPPQRHPDRSGYHADLAEFDRALADYERDTFGDNDTRTTGGDPSDLATIEDPTTAPNVEQLPAVSTQFTPEQFQAWIAADGEMFVVYLPNRQSFVLKVPDVHNAFFVSMMQQIRFCLGSEVQAVRMHVVTGPPADVDGEPIAPASGKAEDAPGWAQPPEPSQFDYLRDHPKGFA
jgi:hypothetical protein